MTHRFHQVRFFLGANSAQGFFSLYDQWVDQAELQAFYALKGGAGCGKSTLMGSIAQRAAQRSWPVEYIHCSGDPDSLDGIYLPSKKTALADGTAPHRMDPIYPGATGHYVDLGRGYDRQALFSCREEIVTATQAYRACYPAASRCFAGAVSCRRQGRALFRTSKALEQVTKYAAALIPTFPARERPGKRARRFLGGPTCQGRLLWKETVEALCQEGYVIRDECGLAGELLAHWERAFLEAGWDVIACLCPEEPDRLEHLLVPGCSLAFVTGTEQEFPLFRAVQTRAFVEESVWQRGKDRAAKADREADALEKEGMDHLAQAKALHDDLESRYHPHVDFSCVTEETERLWQEICLLPDC